MRFSFATIFLALAVAVSAQYGGDSGSGPESAASATKPASSGAAATTKSSAPASSAAASGSSNGASGLGVNGALLGACAGVLAALV